MGTVNARKNIDALDLLVEQHDKVELLFEQIENEEQTERKQFLFDELADNIAAHSTIEEQIFYPAMRAKQTQDILLESTEEHLAIKRVLADLMAIGLDDERFEAKLKVMKEEIHHHAKEEEEEVLFPKLRRLMSAEQLTALGAEMLALFERLMAAKPRLEVPKQTSKAASV